MNVFASNNVANFTKNMYNSFDRNPFDQRKRCAVIEQPTTLKCFFTRGAWIPGARDAARMRYQCERMITRPVSAHPEVAHGVMAETSLHVTFRSGVAAERAQELLDTSIADIIKRAACSKKAFPDVMRRNGRPTLKQPSTYNDEFGTFLGNVWLEFMVFTQPFETVATLPDEQ